MLKEINGRMTCTDCGYEYSAMLGDNEIASDCSCKNDEILFNLISRVESVLNIHSVMIDGLVREVLSEENISDNQVIRRDYDGNSSSEYLVRKMIGEYLFRKHISK